MARWIEIVTGPLEQKRQYRRDRARIDGLPGPYRIAASAMHRYILQAGGITDGAVLVTMIGDLADLWERAAADGTAVRAIVGDDPVDFAESFTQAYQAKQWLDAERARFTRAIADAERQEHP